MPQPPFEIDEEIRRSWTPPGRAYSDPAREQGVHHFHRLLGRSLR